LEHDATVVGPGAKYSPEVNQAAGMVSVQVKCRIEEALMLIADRAQVAGLSMDEIAGAVLDRSISFGE
jgi:hypothetical protein